MTSHALRNRCARVHLYPPQCSHQPRSHLVQFARVLASKLLQYLPPLARKPKDRPALVFFVCSSLDQIFPLRPVNQFNGAVVLQPEPAGRIGDCYRRFMGRTRNLEKKLMLLRLKARLLRRALAEESAGGP